MPKRFVTIWFRYLQTDWFTLRRPTLHGIPFVLASPVHGRLVITAANALAEAQGINIGTVVADARALIPSLEVIDERAGLSPKLLKGLSEWCIRYTPSVSIDPPDGLIFDSSGCAHLWGGEEHYLNGIITRLKSLGYHVRAAMADTIGTAWALSRFGKDGLINGTNQQASALLSLPPAALRLQADTIDLLQKLGLRQIKDFIGMPRSALRRRFGQSFIKKLDQALGHEEEIIHPVQPIEPYQERLPCLEPIVTATGIEIALQRLLNTLCFRLRQEQKGLRAALFTCYRVDGRMEKIDIGTNRPTYNSLHLFKLFEIKIGTIEPALGIELFILEAQKVECVSPVQEKLWEGASGLDNTGLSELLDRLAGKIGADHIHRYIADEHYWPERSVKRASHLEEKSTTEWKADRPRPLQLLSIPEPIEVTAPVPDYPPMLFRHKGKLHKIIKADGPERIEPEWWLQQGQHRDYYCVEDEEGHRYWLFRLGHYDAGRSYQWFMHGFFA
ncbi:MAG: DNA polymerase Y family protein [Chitinophagaceae bacterium]|nr:DNA polymerase Y family protein [Chitinophagaceae bacterium]